MLRVREEESARRIEELEREVERYRPLLVQAPAAAPTADPESGLAPIPSAYRSVQGLSHDSPPAMLERLLLHEVDLQNLEYRRRRRGA